MPDDESDAPQPNPQPKLQSNWLDAKQDSKLADTERTQPDKQISTASSAFLLAAMWLSKESQSNHSAEAENNGANQPASSVPSGNVFSRAERIKRRLSRTMA
jgi:hypothetical protein